MSDNLSPISPASTSAALEATNEVPQTVSVPQDSKSSPVNSLSNETTSTKTKLAIKKPPPPVQAKPSRFLKTKSLTLSSLPKLGHKLSSNSKAKEGSKENTEAVSEPPILQDSKGQQRESHHWKLRGISSLKKNRRHSAVEEVSTVTSDQPRLSTTPPEKYTAVIATVSTPPRQPRELPPLPTIPPLGVPLPLSSTESQNDTLQSNTDRQNVTEALPASLTTADHTPEVVISDMADVKDCNTSSIGDDQNGAQSSLTHSAESLTQQIIANEPQSSSTPKSVHNFAPNGQIEKADTICSLIEKYPQYVPLRIRVLQGYCSDTADVNISTGDLYDVQQIKTTKVVTIRDQDGMSCRVPIESSMKFGLVFNLSSNYDEGLCGYTFRTVSDLTSLSILPRIVCTVRAYEGNDARSSVQENEILVIQQALKSMFRGRRGIKVFSLLTKMEKVLPEECDVGFSTNPSLVRLHPSDIIEHIANPFPAHAVMYPSADNTVEDPGTLSRVITMLDYSTKQSLIVSAVIGENDDIATDESSFFEIPLDDDMKEIEVTVLKWTTPPESPEIPMENEATDADSSDDDDHVYDDTINLLQTSETLRHLAGSRRSSNGFGSASGRSSPGIHIGGTPPLPDKPKWLSQHPSPSDPNPNQPHTPKYDNIPPGLRGTRSEGRRMVPVPQLSEEEDPGYDTVGVHLLRRDGSSTDATGYNKLQYDGYDGGDPRIVSWMEDLQSATNSLESRLVSLEHFHKQMIQSTEMKKMQAILEQLTEKIESFDSQLQSLALSRSKPHDSDHDMVNYHQSPDQPAPGPASDEESNQDYLKSLNEIKVCELIEAMGLGQYKKRFMEEHISGEILLECDEQVLQDELGIQSKIHRIRLMKVITGLHSSKTILDNKK